MHRRHRWLDLSVLLFLWLALLAGCEQSVDWTPRQGETSNAFLHREVEAALQAIGRSESAGGESSGPDALDEARDALLRLQVYYLPLLDAREGADRANRWHHLGQHRRALAELARIETQLLEIAERSGPVLSREMDAPLGHLIAARAAILAGRDDGDHHLEALRTRLNLLLQKGELVLRSADLAR